MPGPREIVGALLGVHVARTLHGRWRRLSSGERDRLAPLASDVKERALDLRGAADTDAAGRGLREASGRLADAIVESAQSDPEVSEIEVRHLREELTRELERLSSAEIQARRGEGRDIRSSAAPPDARG